MRKLIAMLNPFARDFVHAGSFLKGLIVNVVLGYSFYFIARVQQEPPLWAITFIDHLKPTMKAMNVAARLSDNPFPAQVAILYVAVSTIPLTAYFLYLTFFVKEIRQETYKFFCEKVRQRGGFTGGKRLKLVANGVFVLVISTWIFPSFLLIEDPTSTSRIAANFFSNSIYSVGLLLLGSAVAATCFTTSIATISATIFNFLTSKQGAQ
ncbi:MAG: hypothetical protein ABL911_00295 [Gallionella sp.]